MNSSSCWICPAAIRRRSPAVEPRVPTVNSHRSRPSDDDVELLTGERPTGTYSRQLFLAETLDTARIAADYTDRRLRLRVPVKEQFAISHGALTPQHTRHRYRPPSGT